MIRSDLDKKKVLRTDKNRQFSSLSNKNQFEVVPYCTSPLDRAKFFSMNVLPKITYIWKSQWYEIEIGFLESMNM